MLANSPPPPPPPAFHQIYANRNDDKPPSTPPPIAALSREPVYPSGTALELRLQVSGNIADFDDAKQSLVTSRIAEAAGVASADVQLRVDPAADRVGDESSGAGSQQAVASAAQDFFAYVTQNLLHQDASAELVATVHVPFGRTVLGIRGALESRLGTMEGATDLLKLVVLTKPAISVLVGTTDVGIIAQSSRATGRQDRVPSSLSSAANPAAAQTLDDIDEVLRGVQDPAARSKLLGISRQLRGKVATGTPCTVTDPVTGKCLL